MENLFMLGLVLSEKDEKYFADLIQLLVDEWNYFAKLEEFCQKVENLLATS